MAVSFLESVAKAYISRGKDLSEHLFIFPNRRACTFFLRNLSRQMEGDSKMLPQVTTMSDFIEMVSERVVASRIETLFLMYEAYRRLLKSSGVENLPTFDSFRRWGETALSDFNEVDMQNVDSDAIFKNVKDIREISSNFLNEEQLKVMEEFFGKAYDPETLAGNFWRNFNENEDSELNTKFRMLWQVLGPLYHALSEDLEKRGLITSGGAYHRVADLLEEGIPDSIAAKKVVAVGFNALTFSERRIFDALSSYTTDDGSEPFIDFLWDAPGPVIADRSSAAGRYVQWNINRWPAPDWALPYLKEADILDMPENLRVVAVPSNSLQTKIVGEILSEMSKTVGEEEFKDAKVAVVLPDERLLIPMLYSLPESIEDVNLTMGYPLKLTGVYTYVSLLRRMQAGRRKSGEKIGYYYKDLNLVLSHPFSHSLLGTETTKVKEWIRKHHRAIVDISELRNEAPILARLFYPFSENADHREVVGWLDTLLKEVAISLTSESSGILKRDIDLANIEVYRKTLSLVVDLVKEYDIKMQWNTFLSLTDRLLSAETVTFEGQPLKGLQVMGLLETRAIDFDYIIIPSLNERILPAKKRARTFISDSLRKAYGLPPVNYSESIFAYYFYRMIARAKNVVLLYDSRSSDGSRNGDVSRYVLQLKYLYAPKSISIDSLTFEMTQSDLQPHPIPKTATTMEALSSYTDPGPEGNNLSATALTKYAACQLRFYFEHLLRIRTDEEAVDYIDAITQGEVVHFVMQNLYLPKEKQKKYLDNPELIDNKTIKSLIQDTNRIDRLIRKAINQLHFHKPEDKLDTPLSGSTEFVARVLKRQIITILEFDLKQTPFLLHGVEIDGNVSIALRGSSPVNMRFAIDRLDCIKNEQFSESQEMMRVVDYKTGSVHASADSLESVFGGEYSGRNILQLWLYANLFDALPSKHLDKESSRPLLDLFGDNNSLSETPMILELYDVNAIKKGTHTYPKIANQVEYYNRTSNKEFLRLLESMLQEIFDPTRPFKPTTDLGNCRYCPFKTICWR